jgi:hypothetical protein
MSDALNYLIKAHPDAMIVTCTIAAAPTRRPVFARLRSCKEP